MCRQYRYIGVGRHINYLGDILIAVGWTLPCGFSSLIVRHRPVVRVVLSWIHCFTLNNNERCVCGVVQPWTHSMFFIPFLMHREHRDEQRMREKYGATYQEYCRVAKYRIFPFIY